VDSLTLTKKSPQRARPAERPSLQPEGKAGTSRQRIIAAAAELFATHGFEATSIRDIANAVEMTNAALYYHFASKEELFAVVHETGTRSVSETVTAAFTALDDPWDRLEAAGGAHCAAFFNNEGSRTIISAHYAPSLATLIPSLIAQRDRYEAIFADLVCALDLPAEIDRTLFRLHILGALNSLAVWFKSDGELTAEQMGRQIIRHLRIGLETKTAVDRRNPRLIDPKKIDPKKQDTRN
jgi:TetR/AcrR family transcriptional regulator, cholesterol catabolism regulator